MRRQLRIELSDNPAEDIEALSYTLNAIVRNPNVIRTGIHGYWRWGEGGDPHRAFSECWWAIDNPEEVKIRNGVG